MHTLLLLIVAWVALDAVLLAAWLVTRLVAERRRRPAVIAEIGGERFTVDHPSLRRSA